MQVQATSTRFILAVLLLLLTSPLAKKSLEAQPTFPTPIDGANTDTGRTVTVDTDGTLDHPSNFWDTNITDILTAITDSGEDLTVNGTGTFFTLRGTSLLVRPSGTWTAPSNPSGGTVNNHIRGDATNHALWVEGVAGNIGLLVSGEDNALKVLSQDNMDSGPLTLLWRPSSVAATSYPMLEIVDLSASAASKFVTFNDNTTDFFTVYGDGDVVITKDLDVTGEVSADSISITDTFEALTLSAAGGNFVVANPSGDITTAGSITATGSVSAGSVTTVSGNISSSSGDITTVSGDIYVSGGGSLFTGSSADFQVNSTEGTVMTSIIAGQATLSSGTVDVTGLSIDSNDVILLTPEGDEYVHISARTTTEFTIESSDVSSNNTVNYIIIEK